MFEKEINAGVVYLNETYPDWLNKINLESLDLSHAKNCIIGQITGDYYNCKLDFDKKVSLALTAEGMRYNDKSWGILTLEWKDKITQLRSSKESLLDQTVFPKLYTKETVIQLLEEVMNLGMGLRQNQLDGTEDRSGKEVLADFIKSKF